MLNLRIEILDKCISTRNTPLHKIIRHVLHQCGHNAALTFLAIVTYHMSLTLISTKSSILDDYVRMLTLPLMFLPVLTFTKS